METSVILLEIIFLFKNENETKDRYYGKALVVIIVVTDDGERQQ